MYCQQGAVMFRMMEERRVQHQSGASHLTAGEGFPSRTSTVRYNSPFLPFLLKFVPKQNRLRSTIARVASLSPVLGGGGYISCMSVSCRVLVLSWFPTKRKGSQRLTAAKNTSSERCLFAPRGMCRAGCMHA